MSQMVRKLIGLERATTGVVAHCESYQSISVLLMKSRPTSGAKYRPDALLIANSEW